MRRLQIAELDWDKTKRILWFFALGWIGTIVIILVWRGAFLAPGRIFYGMPSSPGAGSWCFLP